VSHKTIFYFLKKVELVKLTLEPTMKVQSGSRCRALLFLNFGDRWGRVVKSTPWTVYTRERDPVPIVHENGWAPVLAGTFVENLAPHRESIRDHNLSSKSLYQLRYPGPFSYLMLCKKLVVFFMGVI
jgi:hypothetical protein